MKLVEVHCSECGEVHKVDPSDALTGGSYLKRCVNALVGEIRKARRALRAAPDPDRMHSAKTYRRWYANDRAEALGERSE